MAVATLRHFLVHFKALREANDPPTTLDSISKECMIAFRPDRPTLEMSLGVTSIALGMVMAGTGDLASLRLLRKLRWRIDEGISYGAAFLTAIH